MQPASSGTLEDLTFVITGATSGIGLAVAELLVERRAAVIGIGQSTEHCRAAVDHLRRAGPHADRIAYITADLSLQSEVRRAAAEVAAALDGWGRPHLDALINNAAVVPFWQTLTSEGFDLQWALNHLAAFLLTMELLPRIGRAPRGRVVTVSSGSHRQGKLYWDDVQLLHHYSPLRAYSSTKLANVLFTLELNRRIAKDSHIRAFAADPGLVNTDLGLKSNSSIARAAWRLRRRGGVIPRRAAFGIVYLASEPSIQSSTDIYWKDCKPVRPGTRASNPQAARQLWELSSQMCGIDK